MNSESLTSGYVVQASSVFQPSQQAPRYFMNVDLLTARQAAFQYAQQIAAQKLSTDVLDVSIHLAEFDGEHVTIPYIAQVFAHRFPRSEHTPEDSPNVIEFSVDVNPDWDGDPLPERLELTMDMTRDDEAFDSPKAVWNSLGDMTCEYEYYRSFDYPAGFGFIALTLSGPQLGQQIPFSTFHLLYDGLTYAARLISNYNQYYGEADGNLSFSTQFLAQH